MKKYFKPLLLIISISILISWKAFQNNDFTFQRDNQKIILRIENQMNFLKWNEKTKLILNTENIDSKKLSVSAPSLKLIKGSTDAENESIWEIIAEKKLIKNDTLKLFISCRDSKDKFWSHQFKILIKEQ